MFSTSWLKKWFSKRIRALRSQGPVGSGGKTLRAQNGLDLTLITILELNIVPPRDQLYQRKHVCPVEEHKENNKHLPKGCFFKDSSFSECWLKSNNLSCPCTDSGRVCARILINDDLSTVWYLYSEFIGPFRNIHVKFSSRFWLLNIYL